MDFIAKISNIIGHGAVLAGNRICIGWTPTNYWVLDPNDEEDAT